MSADFIKEIAPIVQRLTAKYGYGVNSAIIAQACIESAYGTSTKAKHHNYFGLKYRGSRVTCSSGFFEDGSSEETKGGKLVKIVAKWYGFESMEKGVEGYLQFIGIQNYAEARKQKEPYKYLQALKSAGYATSSAYVANNMSVIEKWNLENYDAKGVDDLKINKMISDYNHESRSGQAIKYIVLHYTGNRTDNAKNNANYFAGGDRGASAHYFVDTGSIYQSVYDADAAWHVGRNYGRGNLFGKCTNKNSIGIEMCSSNGRIPAATINRAVKLTKMLMAKYGVPAARVVRHYDVCSKACPGWSGWLPSNESKWSAFKMQLGDTTVSEPAEKDDSFLVQVLIDDLNIRRGPTTRYKVVGQTGKGTFTIVETSVDGKWGKLKSGAGWIYIGNNEWTKRK